MKKLKIGKTIIIIWCILFIIQNTYFGWNFEPKSELESLTDNYIKIIMFIGWVIYILPLVKIYENKVKKLKK